MIELHKLHRLLYAYIIKIIGLELNRMEQHDFSLEAFRLSQKIEQGFSRFSCQLPFDRNLIASAPAQAIELGLSYLEAQSVISRRERNAHLSNFDWKTLQLEEAIQDETKKDLLEALVRNLKFWYNRYSEKVADIAENET